MQPQHIHHASCYMYRIYVQRGTCTCIYRIYTTALYSTQHTAAHYMQLELTAHPYPATYIRNQSTTFAHFDIISAAARCKHTALSCVLLLLASQPAPAASAVTARDLRDALPRLLHYTVQLLLHVLLWPPPLHCCCCTDATACTRSPRRCCCCN